MPTGGCRRSADVGAKGPLSPCHRRLAGQELDMSSDAGEVIGNGVRRLLDRAGGSRGRVIRQRVVCQVPKPGCDRTTAGFAANGGPVGHL